jgi:hypothetical protein
MFYGFDCATFFPCPLAQSAVIYRRVQLSNTNLPHSVPKCPKSGRASLKTRKGRASLKTREGLVQGLPKFKKVPLG